MVSYVSRTSTTRYCIILTILITADTVSERPLYNMIGAATQVCGILKHIESVRDMYMNFSLNKRNDGSVIAGIWKGDITPLVECADSLDCHDQ